MPLPLAILSTSFVVTFSKTVMIKANIGNFKKGQITSLPLVSPIRFWHITWINENKNPVVSPNGLAVKDPALSLLWSMSDPWPWNFNKCGQKKKKKKLKKQEESKNSADLLSCVRRVGSKATGNYAVCTYLYRTDKTPARLSQNYGRISVTCIYCCLPGHLFFSFSFCFVFATPLACGSS